jgi:hypothetical protein
MQPPISVTLPDSLTRSALRWSSNGFAAGAVWCQRLAQGNTDTVGKPAPDLLGPVGLELARAVEHLPGEHAMPGGSRFELKWDGFLH